MSSFPPVDTWTIPNAAWDAAFAEMSRDGRLGSEGITLWLGTRADGVATVSHAVLLRGGGIEKGPAYLSISAGLMNDVTDLAVALGKVLVAQIHSHGPMHGVDLSYVDHTYGVRFPHYLSIVAPDYACRARTTPQECGVHVYEEGKGFVRLEPGDAARRVQLVDLRAEIAEVGDV